jgi:hypothetical protein
MIDEELSRFLDWLSPFLAPLQSRRTKETIGTTTKSNANDHRK